MSFLRAAVGLTALIAVSSGANAQSQNGPSFSCGSVELEAEITVCESRRLSRLDRRLAEAYQAARKEAGWFGARRKLRKEQAAWLEQRNACGDRRRCIRDLYEERVAQLEGSGGSDADNSARPSFNCRTARRGAERRICRSDRLARLDVQLDALYKELHAELPRRRDRRRLKESQEAWLSERDACRDDGRCIRRSYETRIEELERARVPAYHRTAEWRDACRGDVGRTMRTTCDTEVLWQLHLGMGTEYQAALRAAQQRRIRRRIRERHEDWQQSLRRCGDRERCIRRAYRDRRTELRDGGQAVVSRRGYQRTAEWRSVCDTEVGPVIGTICGSERLWGLHQELNRTYKRELKSTRRRRDRRRLEDDQNRWLAARRSCGRHKDCLRRVHEDRLAGLRDGVRASNQIGQAGYRRTADWQRHCPQANYPALLATCNTEQLWALNRQYMREYDRLIANARSVAVRNALVHDNLRWTASWRGCGNNVQCQRRAYRARTDELRSQAYIRRFLGGVRRPKRDPNNTR